MSAKTRRSGLSKVEEKKARKLRKEGKSYTEIAKTLKRRKLTVVNLFPKSGYGEDIKRVKEAEKVSYKQARRKLYSSQKYAERRSERTGKELKRWSEAWVEVNKRYKLESTRLKHIKEYKERYEMIS